MSSFRERHEALKAKIHSFRIPLSKRGRFFMGCVYLSIPVVFGTWYMERVVGPRAEETARMLRSAREQRDLDRAGGDAARAQRLSDQRQEAQHQRLVMLMGVPSKPSADVVRGPARESEELGE